MTISFSNVRLHVQYESSNEGDHSDNEESSDEIQIIEDNP